MSEKIEYCPHGYSEPELGCFDCANDKLELCRKWISSWAWTGSNGSPYTEEQARRLQTLIQNDAWKTYEKIFGNPPL